MKTTKGFTSTPRNTSARKSTTHSNSTIESSTSALLDVRPPNPWLVTSRAVIAAAAAAVSPAVPPLPLSTSPSALTRHTRTTSTSLARSMPSAYPAALNGAQLGFWFVQSQRLARAHPFLGGTRLPVSQAAPRSCRTPAP